jgi:hypothetical protein
MGCKPMGYPPQASRGLTRIVCEGSGSKHSTNDCISHRTREAVLFPRDGVLPFLRTHGQAGRVCYSGRASDEF